jgi:hypothetical protein
MGQITVGVLSEGLGVRIQRVYAAVCFDFKGTVSGSSKNAKFFKDILFRNPTAAILDKPSLQRKSDLCTPRKETAWPLSQFPHSCICVSDFIYSHDGPPIFLQQQQNIRRPNVGIHKSLTET